MTNTEIVKSVREIVIFFNLWFDILEENGLPFMEKTTNRLETTTHHLDKTTNRLEKTANCLFPESMFYVLEKTANRLFT